MTSSLAQLPSTDIRRFVQAAAAERRLAEFIKQGWPVIEPSTPYQHNWHIDAICEALEAVSRGEMSKLVINIPPRHGKSNIVAVFWPAWVWATQPHRRFLFASYAQTLSTKHSMLCRSLIESDWYQERWGDRFALRHDANLKTKFENDKTGLRYSTSVGGAATGEGGDFVVTDDPHNVNQATSDQARENVRYWWDVVMSTRLNDPSTSGRVVIQQRVHQDDLTGHLLETGEWESLILPAEYERHHPFLWPNDPRTEEGEVLWPDRWGTEWLNEKKSELGSFAYAGQYQQRPSPQEGGILKRGWWRFYETAPQMSSIVQSWDLAFKDTKTADFVVGQVWGCDQANRYLLHQIRGRFDFPVTLEKIREMSAWVEERYPQHAGGAKLVEDAANGPAVIATLKREIPGLIPVRPEGGKEARANAVAPQLEAGNVYVPGVAGEQGYDKGLTAPWVQDLIEECLAFPNGAHDDQVDAMTQALIRLTTPPNSERLVRTGGYDQSRLRDR